MPIEKHGAKADVHAVAGVPEVVLADEPTKVRHAEEAARAIMCHKGLGGLKTPFFVDMEAGREQYTAVQYHPPILGDFTFEKLWMLAFLQVYGKTD